MYHSYFGLDDQAFSIAVNPRYLYMSAQHKEALAHLLYGVSSGGFVMLSGEVGTGKTTIIRCLLEQIPEIADLAIVMNPSASARDLLCSICDEFGVGYAPDETSIKVLTDKLTDFLVKNHAKGRKSIVLIDEAQLLRISTLEQVRLLTNLETNTEKLLQIILVGQPELNELLAKPSLRQLSQRITARYHLRPLEAAETQAYILHRLGVAGMPPGRSPFPDEIIQKIHRLSKGIPRLVNILCDRMLLGAYSKGVTVVDGTICHQASTEILGESPQDSFQIPQQWIYLGAGIIGTLIFCLLIMVVVLSSDGTDDKPRKPVEAVATTRQQSIPTKAAESSAVEPVVRASVDYWELSQDRALKTLLDVLGLQYEGALYPCWVIGNQGYKCESMKGQLWDDIRHTNRPVVMTINTPTRQLAYVTLVGLSENSAWLMTGSNVHKISLQELGVMWTGEYTFAWKRPESFEAAIGVGSEGPLVAWIAQQFANMDKQERVITRSLYTSKLERRVKRFQKDHKLKDDGVVGMQTLLKINEVSGVEKTLSGIQQQIISSHP